jgi:hypothetical protein
MRRVLAAPVPAHALTLLVVLLALLPLARPGTVFFPDEGSGLAQARLLSTGQGWNQPPSFPAADPDSRTFPLFNSPTTQRITPLGQHPTYAVLVEPWYAVAGKSGAAALSIVGVVLAAWLGARLAEGLRPGLGIPALWAIGLASPLFFDGYLVDGHTLAAAGIAGAALAVVRVLEGDERIVLAIGAILLAVAAGMVRNEAVLCVAALGIAVGFAGWRTRRWFVAGTGAALLVAAVAGRAADALVRAKVAPVAGGAAPFTIAGEHGSWLSLRTNAAIITTVLPSNGDFGVGDIVLLLAVTCAVAAALVARRRPEDRAGLFLFGGLAVGFAVARLTIIATPVPGLLLACPLVTIALVLANRDVVTSWPRRVLLVAAVLFAGAVFVTQYGNGGGFQWGFRYFAVALPLVLPLALIAIVDGAARLDEGDRRVAGGLLLALCLAVGALSFLALRTTRDDNRAIVEDIRAAYSATPAADGGKPVVVTTEAGTLDRYSWETIAETRWLILDSGDATEVATFLDRIAGLGVGQLTFVTGDVATDRPLVEAHGDVLSDRTLPGKRDVLIVRLHGP